MLPKLVLLRVPVTRYRDGAREGALVVQGGMFCAVRVWCSGGPATLAGPPPRVRVS